MRNNLSKSFFKFAPVVALFAFVAISGAPTAGSLSHPQTSFNSKLNNLNNFTVNYGEDTPGYFDYKNSSEWFYHKKLNNYSEDYGVYYPGHKDATLPDSVIVPVIKSENVININAPIVVPRVHLYNPGSLKWYDGIRYGMTLGSPSEGGYYDYDIWNESLCKLYQGGYGQLNCQGFEVKGMKLGEESQGLKDLSCTFTYEEQLSGNYAQLQDAQIKLNSGSFYDYDTIQIKILYVYYTAEYETVIEGDLLDFNNYRCNSPTSPTYTLHPSRQAFVNKNQITTNFTKQAVWYEAMKSKSAIGSFANESTAKDTIKELIANSVYQPATALTCSSGYFDVGVGYTFTDYSGHTHTPVNHVVQADESFECTHGQSYNIKIAPEYEEESYGSQQFKIKSLHAFNADDPYNQLNAFVKKQTDLIVQKRNVFDHLNPADAFLDPTVKPDENVIFDQFEVYEDATINCARGEYSANFFRTTDTSIQETTITSSTPFELPKNSIVSFEERFKNETLQSCVNLINRSAITSEKWLEEVIPSGNDTFKRLIAEAFKSSESVPYVHSFSDSNIIKLSFRCNDALFIRVLKDKAEDAIITAENKFSTSSTSLAQLTYISTDKSYTITSPGAYEFDFINRVDASCKKIKLNVIDSTKFNLDSTSATNKQFNLNISLPEGETSLTAISLFKKDTAVGHLEDPITPQLTEVIEDPTVLDFEEVTEDDEQHSIAKTRMKYVFKKEGADFEHQFHETYYLAVTLHNEIRAYFIYWNYLPGIADQINVKVTDEQWMSNVGYPTTYDIEISCSTGEDYDPAKNDYKIFGYDESIVEINKTKKTITPLKAGETTATFKLLNSIGTSTTLTFKITDDEKNVRKIIPTSNDVKLTVGEYCEFSAYAQPTKYFTDANITYEIDNPTVATYDATRNRINGVAKGKTFITITYNGVHADELEPLRVPIEVEYVYYSVTVEKNAGGSVSGIKEVYSDGEMTAINITADENHVIDSVLWNEKKIEVTDVTSMIIIQPVSADSILVINFKEKVNPGPEPTPGGGGSNTGMIIGICCGVGALAIGLGTFLIIRAKKVGSMKK